MAEDPDAKSEVIYNPWSNWPKSTKKFLLGIGLFIAVVVVSAPFTCIGSNSMLAKFLFPGIWSENIIDYPEISTDIRTWYPSQARFLPIDIPSNATSIEFSGTNMAALQASPFLYLEFDLNEEDAQIELTRLQSLHPTDVIVTGYLFSLKNYDFADDILVLGFLTEFVPDYQAKIMHASDLVAFVTYDSATGHFSYEFDSD